MRRISGGIAAVGVKELRGRMRGRRAFVILTIYLLLLGGFAWMVELLMERSYTSGFGSSAAYASAAIGQGIFAALLMLETLQVIFLAPAATAGAISLEREKQTLDMLIATPISSVAIVLGKLLSALTYVFLLIVASVPLTAVVFVYGGVSPEDVLKGYAVLLATALGLGAFGLFCSSLVKRTQAATAISIFGVLAVSIGSLFLLVFWTGMAGDGPGPRVRPDQGPGARGRGLRQPVRRPGGRAVRHRAVVRDVVRPHPAARPEQRRRLRRTALLRRRPARRGRERGASCSTAASQVPTDQFGNPISDVAPFGAARDTVWPKSIATWLILSVIFLFLSVQLVSPTRRWRPRLPRRAPKGSVA